MECGRGSSVLDQFLRLVERSRFMVPIHMRKQVFALHEPHQRCVGYQPRASPALRDAALGKDVGKRRPIGGGGAVWNYTRPLGKFTIMRLNIPSAPMGRRAPGARSQG